MAETLPFHSQYTEGGVSELQYQGPPLQITRRWEPYKYTEIGLDVHKISIDKVRLAGHETILDVGCADGRLLKELLVQRQHSGRLIGIDPNIGQAGIFELMLDKEVKNPVEFYEGTVQNIKLEDNTADHTFFHFAMYHVPPEEQTLAVNELKRVTKPGGKIVISTSSEANKPRHRKFEAVLGRFFGSDPPRRMNEWFTSEIAYEFIPRCFADFEHTIIRDQMVFDANTYPVYLESLLTMNTEFEPPISGPIFERALNEVIKPQILKKIASDGQFTDNIARDLWVCTNSPQE